MGMYAIYLNAFIFLKGHKSFEDEVHAIFKEYLIWFNS
jgi:hypothetical protein